MEVGQSFLDSFLIDKLVTGISMDYGSNIKMDSEMCRETTGSETNMSSR